MASTHAHTSSRAVSWVLIGATAIGFSPIFVRLSELGPIATAFHRVFLALPVLGVWWWLQRRRVSEKIEPESLRWLIAAGVFFAADLSVWHWSIRLTSVANATLLGNLAPVFVVLAGWALFSQRFTRKFLSALALTLTGMFLIFGDSLSFGSTRILGDLLGVLTAVFYAAYIICVARLRATVSTVTVMFVSAAVSALVLLPVALLSGENLIPASAYGWAVLAGLAWIAHVGGQGLIAHAYGFLSAALGALTQLWQPVAAAVLAWVLLQEPLGGWQALGGVVVLIGIYRARLADRPRKERE